MTANEIIRAPDGALKPWLPGQYPDGTLRYRPVDEHRAGLVLTEDRGIRIVSMDNDPDLRELRATNADLAKQLERAKRNG